MTQKPIHNLDDLPPEIRARFRAPTPDEEKLIRSALTSFSKRSMAPYFKTFRQNRDRALSLVNMYTARLRKYGLVKTTRDGSEDILRAVVVLTHASLEDFLRTVAETFLPYADEKALNNIPFVGREGRAEKLLLGTLGPHRGKSVDSVIQESVSQYLERSNYNKIQEIVSLLKDLNLDPSPHKGSFPKLAAMIARRHQIVHRGDMIKTEGSKKLSIAPLSVFDVINWVQATNDFMFGLLPQLVEKQLEIDLMQKVLQNRHRNKRRNDLVGQ